MAGTAQHDDVPQPYTEPKTSASALPPTAPTLSRRTVRRVSLFLPPTRKRAFVAAFEQFTEEVLAPILRARDLTAVRQALEEPDEHTTTLVRFLWGALDGYESAAVDQVIRTGFDQYESDSRTPKAPRIRPASRVAHDQAFALILAARRRLSTIDPTAPLFPQSLVRRATRILVRVEVLSGAVIVAISGERKARSVKLLEGLIGELFRASLGMYMVVQELVSVASVTHGPVQRTRLTSELRTSGRAFVLNDHLPIDVVTEEGGIMVYLHALALCAGGRTADEAYGILVALFASSWDAVVVPDEGNLSLDALALRARMRELVRDVERVP